MAQRARPAPTLSQSKINDEVCVPSTGAPLTARRPHANSLAVVTPINIPSLSKILSNYPNKNYLIDGFSEGFHLRYKAPPFSSFSRNHQSATLHANALNDLVDRELSAGRIAGPFSSPPFDNFVVSPLGVVPKKEPGKFRLIHDLSFPRKPPNSSVNDGIDPIDATVSYETFDEVIALLHRTGKGALMAKVYIENTFRIIPIHPSD